MSTKRISGNLPRDLFVLEDEKNPSGSNMKTVWPSTVLDQVFDDQSPTKRTLRQILEDLRIEIITGGKGNIVFPVTSVNGKTDDVNLTARDIGLENVDNTKDMDKPLSDPQRNSVMNILRYYNFNVDLHELYGHIASFDNPHNITVSQLDNDGKLSNLIQKYIKLHNQSTDDSTHMDIRNSINRLWDRVDAFKETANSDTTRVMSIVSEHLGDMSAHQEIFDTKEDISNKVLSFTTTTNKDHTKYPSTRAVVEFVQSQISAFEDTLPDLKDWIDDIEVVNGRDDLPMATSASYRKMFFIRHGNSSHDEIAVCRVNPDGETYSWDITPLGTYSKFDPKYFIDTIDGMSVNIGAIMDAAISENGMLDTSLSETLNQYYTKEEIDEKHFVGAIKILPGTMDGYIRYYINDDLETMSDDVRVPGLKRLAFLEWITENELWDQSVHERHILSKAVATRHLQERAVTGDKMFTSLESNMILAVVDPGSDPIYTKVTSRMIAEGEIDATKIRSSDEDNRVLGVLKAGRNPVYTTINRDMLEDNIIGTQQLIDRSVTTPKLADRSITSDKLAPGAINTDLLAASSVGTDQIIENSITTEKLLNGSVTTEKISNSSVTYEKMANNSVGNNCIIDSAVTTNKIQTAAITTQKIADKNVTTEKLNDQSVITEKIKDAAVTTLKISDAAITTSKIADASVVTDKLGDKSVTTSKVADKAITTENLNDKSVTTEKVNDLSITNEKLSNNSVSTDKVVDKAITESKLGDGSVTTNKLHASAVTTEKIEDASITTAKMADGSVTTAKIAEKNVTNDKLSDRSVDGRTVFTSSIANRVLVVHESLTDPCWEQINQEMIEENAVVTKHIKDRNVTDDKLSDNAVTVRSISDGAVTNPKLASKAVTTDKLEDKSVTTDKIADDAVVGKKIKDRSIDHNKIVCTFDHILGNIKNDENDHGHEISIEELAISLKRFRVPSNMPTHLWKPNTEYSFNDGSSYGCRFRGIITSEAGKKVTTLLTSQINLESYHFVEAGGTWEYKSNPSGCISLTSSGDFVSFVRMEENGLYLETVSPNDRIDARYDVWIKYTKSGEVIQPMNPDGEFLEDPVLKCDTSCVDAATEPDIESMWDGTYDVEEDPTDYIDSVCVPITADDIRSMWDGTYEEPEDDCVECSGCYEITPNIVRTMYGLDPIENDGSLDASILTSHNGISCSGNCEECNAKL